jgi:hypothetical protein
VTSLGTPGPSQEESENTVVAKMDSSTFGICRKNTSEKRSRGPRHLQISHLGSSSHLPCDIEVVKFLFVLVQSRASLTLTPEGLTLLKRHLNQVSVDVTSEQVFRMGFQSSRYEATSGPRPQPRDTLFRWLQQGSALNST